MKRVTALLLAFLMGGAILLSSSCATAPTGPVAPGEVRLLRIDVPNEVGVRRSLTFTVNIVFEADGKPEIKTACFSFSGDGPYCYKVLDVEYGSPGTIRVEPRAKMSGMFVMEVHVLYVRDGKTQPSKKISTPITVN